MPISQWIVWGYNLEYRQIRQAYRSARDAFMREEKTIQDEAEAFIKEHGEDKSPEALDFAETFGDRAYDTSKALEALREAFAITVYHFWEKQTAKFPRSVEQLRRDQVARQRQRRRREGRKTNFVRFDSNLMMDRLEKSPDFDIDKEALKRARELANFLKHGSRARLFEAWPEIFDPVEVGPTDTDESQPIALPIYRTGINGQFNLTPERLEEVFETIRRSGPRRAGSPNNIEEMD